jgi:hypothetical protein
MAQAEGVAVTPAPVCDRSDPLAPLLAARALRRQRVLQALARHPSLLAMQPESGQARPYLKPRVQAMGLMSPKMAVDQPSVSEP